MAIYLYVYINIYIYIYIYAYHSISISSIDEHQKLHSVGYPTQMKLTQRT